MEQLQNPEERVIYGFEVDMSSDQCGYPICCPGTNHLFLTKLAFKSLTLDFIRINHFAAGNQPHIKKPEFYPESLVTLDLADKVNELCQEMDEIFHSTGMPMFPCLLHHFCLPFSPICAAAYCGQRRRSELFEAIEKFNTKFGKKHVLTMLIKLKSSS